MKKPNIKFSLAGVIILTMGIAGLAGLTINDYLQKNQNGDETYQSRLEDKLDAYLSKLAGHECTGKCAGEKEFRIVDSNKKYSYGCLQFQEETYLIQARKYDIDPWADGGIYNCENQKKVARKMFEENKLAAADHWYTSIYKRNLGLPEI